METARGEIVRQRQDLLGRQGAQAVQGLLESVNKPVEGITATILGVILLVWVYYSAQVLLMGAEFTWAYALTLGSRKEQDLPVVAPVIPSQTPPGRTDARLLPAKQAAEKLPGKDPGTHL